MATTKTQPVKEDRLTTAQVINHLNEQFIWMGDQVTIRFRKQEGLDYSIAVYVKGNALMEETTCNFKFTKAFFRILHKELMKIGIHAEPQWNNGGNIFSCWINSNTCAWDK